MSKFIIATIAFLLTLTPLFFALLKKNNKRAKKIALLCNIISVFALVIIITATSFTGAAHASEVAEHTEDAMTTDGGISTGLAFIGAGLAIFGSCIGGGIAVASSASAALGAISENEGLFGKALIMVVLAEGIAIYGMLISVLILGNI